MDFRKGCKLAPHDDTEQVQEREKEVERHEVENLLENINVQDKGPEKVCERIFKRYYKYL